MQPATDPRLTMSVDEQVDAFVTLTRGLMDLIRQENDLLKANKIQEVAPLIAEKSRLTSLYIRDMQALKRQQARLGDENSPLRQAIRAVTREFAELISEHGRILNRLKTITDGIVETVKREVTRQVHPAAGYAANAKVNVSAATPTSFAYNKNV